MGLHLNHKERDIVRKNNETAVGQEAAPAKKKKNRWVSWLGLLASALLIGVTGQFLRQIWETQFVPPELMKQGCMILGGVLLVAVYPGHAEGDAEGKMVQEYFSTLDRHVICCTLIRIVNSPSSPFFFVIEKK